MEHVPTPIQQGKTVDHPRADGVTHNDRFGQIVQVAQVGRRYVQATMVLVGKIDELGVVVCLA
jgi:hypothetical protein